MTEARPPHEDRRFAIFLGGLLLASFPLIWIGIRSLVIRDFAAFGFPLAVFHKTAFWNGSLPLWNPLNFCGVPHLAQWNSLLLYPGSLIYLLLPLPWSLNLFCLVHQFIGGLGMARLARSITGDPRAAAVSGIAYAFSGLTLNALMWPNNMAALGLLPWVIWTTCRAVHKGGRRLPLAVLVGAGQMLTGAPEIILVTWIFVGAWLVADPPADRLVGGVSRLASIILLISLITAAQLLPFFELLNFANRPGAGSASGWSASPSVWVNLLLPGYQGVQTGLGYPLNHFQKWTLSLYPGMLTLIGSLFAFRRGERRPLILGCLGLGGLALASGHYSVAYQWLAGFAPLDLMRFPVKFMLLPAVALPLLAGIGWARLHRDPPTCIHFITGVVILSVLFTLAVGLDHGSNAARPERDGKSTEALLRGVFLLGAFAILGLRTRLGAVTPWLVAIVLWIDLRWHMPAMTTTVDSSAFQTEAVAMATPPARLHVTRNAWSGLYALITPNAEADLREHLNGRTALLNLASGEAKVGGFLSLTPPHARDLAEVIDGDDWRAVNEPLADFVGVHALGRWRDGVDWQERAGAAPLVTSGQDPSFIGSPDQQLEHLRRPGFDPFTEVCLYDSEAGVLPTRAPPAEILLTSFSPHEIRFRARATDSAIAVVAQSWYPAWKAYVNGKPVPLRRANVQFQALALPPGHSEVVLRYEDRAFHLGVLLSIMGLAATAVLWRKTSAPPSNNDPARVGEVERPVRRQ